MKISVDTETEEIAELRAAVAIIEEAVKRRDNGEEQSKMEGPSQETSVPEQTDQQLSNYEQPQRKVEENPPVDLSPLATSDYGERMESRDVGSSSGISNSEPVSESGDKKKDMLDVINTLKSKNPGKPVYMQDIIDLAKEKTISEDEARNLVNDLQSSGEI